MKMVDSTLIKVKTFLQFLNLRYIYMLYLQTDTERIVTIKKSISNFIFVENIHRSIQKS